MGFNQLFLKKPPLDIITNIFNILGFDLDTENKSFSQNTISNNYDKIFPLILSLKKYYLPCKANIYFESLTSKKVITILKQCLKIYDYKLVSKEIYLKELKKKKLYYSLKNNTIPNKPKINNSYQYNTRSENIILSFD